MQEEEILHRSDSEPAAMLEPAQKSFGDFSRMLLLMSLEAELRALVRKMNAAQCLR